ncbi:replication protein A 70 kDa DNA-binding subunit C [Trifolium repens]|nr:replication protein A 70 kDa DNA-binding subunit C [Trifolium repens]
MVCNEKATVDSKIDDVADIASGRDNFCIRVRVVRLWKVPAFLNPSEYSSIEMVLIDEKSGKIHASIRKQLIGLYRTTLHPYKIIFLLKTKLNLSEGAGISEFGLTFTKIDEICAHTHDYEYLVVVCFATYVIGVVTGMSAEREYVRDGKITKMIIVELTDHSGKCECALFGDYVDEVNKKIEKSAVGLPIVVIQFAKVKIFRDKASIQNVINTTRIFVNPDIPEVETFKNSIAVHGIEVDSTVPLIGESAKPTPNEEFLRMHPKKTLEELVCATDGGVFVVFAEVVRVTHGQDWWYPACRCHKSVSPNSGAYFCNSCNKHVFQVIPRFRVKLEVTDGKSTGVFVLFDSDMSHLMEKSCSFFVAQSKANNSGPHPVEFDSLAGKKMLFIVDAVSNQTAVSDGSYRVKRVCMDSKIIEVFCSQCPVNSPSKTLSNPIDLDSGTDTCGSDAGDDLQSSQFVDDFIITPPMYRVDDETDSDAPAVFKRNLSKDFDRVSKGRSSVRRKRVKIEKD